MGWISLHYDGPLNTAAQKKAAMHEEFGNNPEWGTILKDSFVGGTYYAAVKSTSTGKVFGWIVRVEVDEDEYDNLSYNDMYETCGPLYADCPVGIIKLLSPTEDENALKWREQCLQNAKQKNRVVRNGDIIIFEKSIRFYPSNTECQRFKVCKYPRRQTYFLMLEGAEEYCRIDGWRKMDFRIAS